MFAISPQQRINKSLQIIRSRLAKMGVVSRATSADGVATSKPLPINLGNNGNLGNKIFQYMYCRELQEFLPNARLFALNMPEFGMVSDPAVLEGNVLHIRDGHLHDMPALAKTLSHGPYDGMLFEGYVQRLEYYRNRQACASYFKAEVEVDKTHLGREKLTINVRGNEILGNIHKDYFPIPVAFMEHVANITKLDPVIMGQLGDDPYSDEIRRRFSGCVFLPSISAAEDFEIVRNSTNILASVSSFSWLASWFSDTAQSIHFPVRGLFNPLQRPDINLLPTRDGRYRFYGFPVAHWTAAPEQYNGLLAPEADFWPMSAHQARALIS